MATSRTVISQLSTATGIPQVTLAHIVRRLREDPRDLWPLSPKGGGKSARHVEPVHLANLFLGFGGTQPSGAPRMVNHLGATRCSGEKRAARSPNSSYALSNRALLASQG